MDFNEIKDAMKFLNWELVISIVVMVSAFTQWLKKYVPEIIVIGKARIPVADLIVFASGFVFSHFIFDISGAKHTEGVALFHGFFGSLLSILGYELLKGTRLGFRSTAELKNGKEIVKDAPKA